MNDSPNSLVLTRNSIKCIGIANDSPKHCKNSFRKKLEMMLYEYEWLIPTVQIIDGSQTSTGDGIFLQMVRTP